MGKRYGISPVIVQKWRDPQTTADAALGAKEPRSTVLRPEEPAIVAAARRRTLLPPDDCFYGLRLAMPRPTHAGEQGR